MKLSAEFHKVLDSKLMRKAANHKKTILLTVLAVLSAVSIMSVGPTYAYLKMNGASKAENSFSAAPNVETTLNSDYSVTVSDSGLLNRTAPFIGSDEIPLCLGRTEPSPTKAQRPLARSSFRIYS